MKKTGHYIFFILILFSCNDNPQNPSTRDKELSKTNILEVKENNKFVLEMDIEMSEPEDLKLMAVNTFLNNGQYIDIYITQKVNSNETSKTVRFEMPEDISPDNFVGISLGQKKIKKVQISRINLSYKNIEYNIQSEAVIEFFKTNMYVNYDEASNQFITKSVGGSHNPILILRKIYIDKIQGLR